MTCFGQHLSCAYIQSEAQAKHLETCALFFARACRYLFGTPGEALVIEVKLCTISMDLNLPVRHL